MGGKGEEEEKEEKMGVVVGSEKGERRIMKEVG